MSAETSELARLERYREEWGWHEDTDERMTGYGHHMAQMLRRLPIDSQTEDMRTSILAMLDDLDRLAARDAEHAARLAAVETERDRLRAATPEPARLYTETIGTTCSLAGQRGTVTGLLTHPAHGVLGAFVSLDGPVDQEGRYLAPGAMLHVTLGKRAGERGQHHEVTGWTVIDRDGFDRLCELDTLRKDMGWRDA